ncbi:unnamed protein product [Urochloa humidicola]
MMARLQASSLLAVVAAAVAAVAAVLATPASGATYTVGEPGGSWDLKTDLTAWASSINFRAGDELVFKYDAAVHNVVEVDRDGYLSCSAASPVSAALRTGNDIVQLGGVSLTRYFICGVPGHCAAGMKLEVRAVCSSTTALPPPAPPGTGAPGGITICSGGPSTVIMTPGVVSYGSGAAPGSSATLNSVLVTMASLLLAGLIIV